MQKKHNLNYLVMVPKSDAKCRNAFKKKNNAYYKLLLQLSKSINSTVIECPSPYCVQSYANEVKMTSYRKNVDREYKLPKLLKKCIPVARQNVPCTRSAEACRESSRKNYSLSRALKKYSKKLRNLNISESKKVPGMTCEE